MRFSSVYRVKCPVCFREVTAETGATEVPPHAPPVRSPEKNLVRTVAARVHELEDLLNEPPK
jgi:hypothetical protein